MKKKKEETTDVDLFTTAQKNKNLINQFMVAVAEASIDCSSHEPDFSKSVKEKIKCMMCSPNNKELYHSNIHKDLSLPNPCEKLQSDTVKATEILIDGVKYYYSKSDDKYMIFKFDDAVNGYIPLNQHEYPYSEIMEKILKL